MIDVQGLEIYFEQQGLTKAFIRDMNFRLEEGQVLGIVGESGCGKSITNFALMGLLPVNASFKAERINIFGTDLLGLNNQGWNQYRGNTAAMIFQDPMTALNPCLTVGQQLTEVIEKKYPSLKKIQVRKKAEELLEQVGITFAALRLKAYPHELSGGMAQRVMIAMALASQPKLLIADEPTTALDVVVQKQILDLLLDLRDTYRMSIILVSHDIGVIKHYSDIMLVMYSGEIVESGYTHSLIQQPQHPYTQGLLSSLPGAQGNTPKTPLPVIPGNIIPIDQETVGCRFRNRCTSASSACEYSPSLKPLASDPTRMLRCYL